MLLETQCLVLLLFVVGKGGIEPPHNTVLPVRSNTELLPHFKARHRWPLCGVSRLRHWALDVLWNGAGEGNRTLIRLASGSLEGCCPANGPLPRNLTSSDFLC